VSVSRIHTKPRRHNAGPAPERRSTSTSTARRCRDCRAIVCQDVCRYMWELILLRTDREQRLSSIHHPDQTDPPSGASTATGRASRYRTSVDDRPPTGEEFECYLPRRGDDPFGSIRVPRDRRLKGLSCVCAGRPLLQRGQVITEGSTTWSPRIGPKPNHPSRNPMEP